MPSVAFGDYQKKNSPEFSLTIQINYYIIYSQLNRKKEVIV